MFQVRPAKAEDLDKDGACAWLLGPFAEGTESKVTADALLERAASSLPRWVKVIRQYLEQRNVAGIELHSRLGYRESSVNHQYSVRRDEGSVSAGECARRVKPSEHGALMALHEASFPKGWLTPKRLIERIGADAALFVTSEDETLLVIAS